MVAEILDLVVAVEIEILAAVKVGILRIGVLDSILIKVGPSPVYNPLKDLSLLGPSNL